MLKKLAFSGAVLAAFAGLAMATPAQADTWPKPSSTERNIATQTGSIVVCGNRGTDGVTTIAAPLGPITNADNESVNCNQVIQQDGEE